MKLPCITFKLGSLSASRSSSGHVFRAQTSSLGIVEIRSEDDLSQFGSLHVVHPWIDFLLDLQPVRSVADMIPEENTDDWSSSIGELPLFPGPSGIMLAAPWRWAVQLVAHLGRSISGWTTTFPGDAVSLIPFIIIANRKGDASAPSHRSTETTIWRAAAHTGPRECGSI